jgi:hypothetical protein
MPRRLTPEQKFERALIKQDKKQLKALKLERMPVDVANSRYRLKSFIGPNLPAVPKKTRVQKTPEQRFEQALLKQERKQLRALKLERMSVDVANSRNRLKSFIGPNLPAVPKKTRVQKTKEEKFEEALKKQERKQLKALKLATMPVDVANSRNRLKSFIGPNLPIVPSTRVRRTRVRKTPEQKFEQALARQDRQQLNSLRLITMPVSQTEMEKRAIRNQKARERYARKRLMDLAQSVPLPASPIPVRPRVRRVIRQYPALPASYR